MVFLFCKATQNYGPHTGKDHRELPGLRRPESTISFPSSSWEETLILQRKPAARGEIRVNPEESARKLGNESHPYSCLPWPFFLPLCFSLTPLTNGYSATHQFVYEGRALPDILPLTLSISLLNQKDGDTPVPRWAPLSQAWRADQFLAPMGINGHKVRWGLWLISPSTHTLRLGVLIADSPC